MSTLVHGPSFKKYAEEYKDVCLAACCDLDEEKAKEYISYIVNTEENHSLKLLQVTQLMQQNIF